MQRRILTAAFVGVAASAAMLAGMTAHGEADAASLTDPVELIVGAGAGGGNDNIARTMQRIISAGSLIPTSMSVVNKPGGGGSIAFSYLQQKKGSPHHIAISSNTLLTNYVTGKSKLQWSDFTPLAVLINEYIALVVKADSPYSSGGGLLEKMKAAPGSVVVGISSSLGNINHIAVSDIVSEAGIDPRKLKVVVFPSSSQSITALLGGHVDVVAGPPSIAGKHIEAGKLRALGVTAPQRLGGGLADVPTWREQGIDAIVVNWRGVLGAPGLPAEDAEHWVQVLQKLVGTDEWQRDLERNHWESAALYGAKAAAYMKTQSESLRKSLQHLGLVK